MSRLLSIVALCVLLFDTCPAKPTQVLQNSEALNPVQHEKALLPVEPDTKRDQRSPQFGFPGEGFDPFVPEFDNERRYGFKHHHKHHHKPPGCREFGCGGYGPGYYPPPPPVLGGAGEASAVASAGSAGIGGGEGSFASANAGEGNARPFGPFGAPFGGGESQANAQSASFNFGPFGSASFSVAEASSAGQRF